MKIDFPSIRIDYNTLLGDVVTITRNTTVYNAIVNYLDSVVVTPNVGPAITVDISDLDKTNPLILQLIINKILIDVVYADYTKELQNIICLGQRGLNLVQESFDFEITQPTINSENAYIDPYWRVVFSKNDKFLLTIKRHAEVPNVYYLSFPSCEQEITITGTDITIKIPSLIKSINTVDIDLAIQTISNE